MAGVDASLHPGASGRVFRHGVTRRRPGNVPRALQPPIQAATGHTPAACVLELRLSEARRRPRETSAPLKDIAAATGFADANHLCKAFRRHFHLSPGAYRSQLP